MRPIRYAVILLLASACTTTTTPSTTAITPSTFVMTWATLAFPQTPIGAKTATPVVITLSNYGAAGVAVASVSSSNPSEFPVTSSCAVGASLASKSTCQVSANFIPSAAGARTATLTINANAIAQALDLTGTGVTPATPQLTIDQKSGPPSTIFTMSVTGATPSGSLTLNTIYTAPGSPGVLSTSTGWVVDASGNATIATNSDDPGTYESWVVDTATGTSSNHVTHRVQ